MSIRVGGSRRTKRGSVWASMPLHTFVMLLLLAWPWVLWVLAVRLLILAVLWLLLAVAWGGHTIAVLIRELTQVSKGKGKKRGVGMRRISIAAAVLAAGLAAGGISAGIAQAATAGSAGNPQQAANKTVCSELREWLQQRPSQRTVGEAAVMLYDSRGASIILVDDLAEWVNSNEPLSSWTQNLIFDCANLPGVNGHGR